MYTIHLTMRRAHSWRHARFHIHCDDARERDRVEQEIIDYLKQRVLECDHFKDAPQVA